MQIDGQVQVVVAVGRHRANEEGVGPGQGGGEPLRRRVVGAADIGDDVVELQSGPWTQGKSVVVVPRGEPHRERHCGKTRQ